MIEKISINKIFSNPVNPRLIKQDKFKKLVKSIKDFPEMLKLRPIVVNSEYGILGGNMRYKACQELGMEEIWIIKAEKLTDKQIQQFIIKDNVGFGEWDWDTLANMWEVDELTDWGLDLPILNERLEVIKDEEPELEITEEILEEHNYVVFTFDNSLDWNVIKDVFDIKEVNKLDRHLKDKGMGRVINGMKLINKLNGL
tara:strand:+ start:49 stop:645 length:597 start_codon:yes stop_codon:yes gene_type:complete